MSKEEKDIFDRIMDAPILRIFNPFYQEHKEILLYLFFGGCTTIISIGSFAIFNVVLGINELIANVISWILAVLFAFFTNRTWVFKSHVDGIINFVKQMGSFVSGRILTLLIEEIILAIFITWLGMNSMVVKLSAQIIVVILNYVISKIWVFKK